MEVKTSAEVGSEKDDSSELANEDTGADEIARTRKW